MAMPVLEASDSPIPKMSATRLPGCGGARGSEPRSSRPLDLPSPFLSLTGVAFLRLRRLRFC